MASSSFAALSSSMTSLTDCADDPGISMLPTPPSTHTSRSTSPVFPSLGDEDIIVDQQAIATATKKKKKKRTKKATAKTKEAADGTTNDAERSPVLCISRNKHWRYISSYHGPWLQLPLELLESLLLLNVDPATLSAADSKLPQIPSYPHTNGHSYRHNHANDHSLGHGYGHNKQRGFASLADYSPPDSPRTTYATLSASPPFPSPLPGQATPPPIDPGVFRSVTHIRRLIDEAAELSVRASSGLSAAALGSMRCAGALNGNAWTTAQSFGLGMNPLGDGGGRNVAMSAMRVHRLRALAVQKLAAAYRTDEIASSVMVMQGGSVFEDIAERVLKVDSNDIDARYVHFFHEKIPSRQLAESTSTHVLDELIAGNPHRLEFYRTRGIVHCFRDEYAAAAKDFTYAIKEARLQRKARNAHLGSILSDKQRGKGTKKKKGKTNGQAPANGTSVVSTGGADCPSVEGSDSDGVILHPSVLPDAPDPIEPQCLFLRASAYLQHAAFIIENAILKMENIPKVPSIDGAEMRLCSLENGRYGGTEIGNPDGPLGKADGPKLQAYRSVFTDGAFRETISTLVKKSMRDHKQFLAHFDTLEGPPGYADADIAQRTEYAFLLSESLRPGSQSAPPPVSNSPPMFTTYHPLLVESHFSILLCYLMLGDFPGLLPVFSRTAALVDGLEGYPVFLPPRSMAQADFIEILERLAGGWRNGIQPHSLSRANSKQLAIEAPPRPSRSPKAKEVSRIPTPPSPKLGSFIAGSSGSNYLLGVNGSSSSSVPSLGAGACSSSIRGMHLQTLPSPGPNADSDRPRSPNELDEALDAARILLAPVVKRQREKGEKVEAQKNGKSGGKNGKPLNINIPLHGPRVDIILAWLAAVFLCELDTAAV